jgi:hypothetical protein
MAIEPTRALVAVDANTGPDRDDEAAIDEEGHED